MKNIELNEIRKKDMSSIDTDIKNKQLENFEEKMQIVMQKSQNFFKSRTLRREVAVLYTIKKEKELLNV